MLRLASFSVLAFIILNVQGSLAYSQDNRNSVRLPQDAPIHCGDFCLATLQPMMDLILAMNSKLETIHSEQQSIKMQLLAVQSTVKAQRITMQNSLKDIPTKEEFGATLNETEEKFLTDLKYLLQYIQANLKDQQKPLLDSLQRTFTKDDLEMRLNVTEDQLLASNSELKTQLKEMHTDLRDQEISMKARLDAQLLAIQENLEDKFMAINSDRITRDYWPFPGVRDQQTSMQSLQDAPFETNLEDQQKPLLDSLQRTFTKDDLEMRLNVTEDLLLASNSELKTQLKEVHTDLRDQEISMKARLDAQLLAIQENLEDKLMAINSDMKNQFQFLLTKMTDLQTCMQCQKDAQLPEVQKTTSEPDSSETELSSTEGQQPMTETEIDEQPEELQSTTENHLSTL
ncbi:keratin, type I cytoskeletal 9-like [Drosophila takahashii]|uniref:keratin, type I cytoskeletal 9-like n=1 Tax=Drosophila takahashii TaxID=29030 RepID=UPI003899072E